MNNTNQEWQSAQNRKNTVNFCNLQFYTNRSAWDTQIESTKQRNPVSNIKNVTIDITDDVTYIKMNSHKKTTRC